MILYDEKREDIYIEHIFDILRIVEEIIKRPPILMKLE
jgi:hypothetical protein